VTLLHLKKYYCFSCIESFKNQNLLDTYDSGSPGRFARSILKKLFIRAQMSESILYPNNNYAKHGLDANRMKLFKGESLLFLIYTLKAHFFPFPTCVFV